MTLEQLYKMVGDAINNYGNQTEFHFVNSRDTQAVNDSAKIKLGFLMRGGTAGSGLDGKGQEWLTPQDIRNRKIKVSDVKAIAVFNPCVEKEVN